MVWTRNFPVTFCRSLKLLPIIGIPKLFFLIFFYNIFSFSKLFIIFIHKINLSILLVPWKWSLRSPTAGSISNQWPRCCALNSAAAFTAWPHLAWAALGHWLRVAGIPREVCAWGTLESSDGQPELKDFPVALLNARRIALQSNIFPSFSLSFCHLIVFPSLLDFFPIFFSQSLLLINLLYT